jgi:lipocalin
VSISGKPDVLRYMGTWYEIAKLPAWFQKKKKCVDTRAGHLAARSAMWSHQPLRK